jgi:lipopolysaccharide/colanic/teichoic acid biosynthesis glycosyltransferase
MRDTTLLESVCKPAGNADVAPDELAFNAMDFTSESDLTQRWTKRTFDFVLATFAFLVLLPVFLIIGIVIMLDSRGGVFYRQTRVGLRNKNFGLFKFRTMKTGSDQFGLLTVGSRDNRITRCGYFLRKTKLDELPQLLNVITGDMSFVGPRPEVSKYVRLYTNEQKRVLTVRPGMTDWASIKYINESEILKKAADPEQFYITNIMPSKLKLNLLYISHNNALIDLKIILLTIRKIIINLLSPYKAVWFPGTRPATTARPRFSRLILGEKLFQQVLVSKEVSDPLFQIVPQDETLGMVKQMKIVPEYNGKSKEFLHIGEELVENVV